MNTSITTFSAAKKWKNGLTHEEILKRLTIADIVRYKLFAYNVIRMEEEDAFWYHCGQLVGAISKYFEEREEDNREWRISEIVIFLHKHCKESRYRW